jgi:hypothetical protein
VALAASGCAARREGVPALPVDEGAFGVYRARVEPVEGRPRRLRLWLHATLPDRLHAEIVSPLGTPQLILDAAGRRVALTFVREGESFVGEAGPDLMEGLLGVPVAIDKLAAALLEGRPPCDGCRFERTGGEEGRLPARLVVEAEEGRLTLELKRLLPLEGGRSGLGTGRAPEGTRVRPLADLEAETTRLERMGSEEEAR